jgi:hypothetical protein
MERKLSLNLLSFLLYEYAMVQRNFVFDAGELQNFQQLKFKVIDNSFREQWLL